MSAGDIEQAAASPAAIRPSQVIDDWSPSTAFDAAEALDRHPELANERSIVLDWAFEEYCQRIDRGESVDTSVFAQRFADVEHSLLGLIQARQFLHDNLPVLQGLSEVNWPVVGSDFAGYELIEELGRGAFSRVFVARERSLGGRQVAAKVCWRGSDEAMRLGRLEHPGIMPVHSVHLEAETGLNVIVMPLLSRTTLAGALDIAGVSGRLPRRAAELWDAIRENNIHSSNGPAPKRNRRYRPRHAYETTIAHIGLQLAEGLSYAHTQGVVHGDLKPSNVLLLPSGDAVLMDFNLAFEREEDLQRAGGTLPYMPPELLCRLQKPEQPAANAGKLRPDERSDMFSLGATLYECLTGRLPFGTVPEGSRRQIISELLDRQRRGPVPPMELNDRIEPALDALIRSCLAYDLDDRPASAADVAAALRKSVSLRQRTIHTIRRWPRLAAGLCALLMLAVGLTAHSIATLPPPEIRELKLGWTAEGLGDYAAAIGHYERALAYNPDCHEARFSLGCVSLRTDVEASVFNAFEEFNQLWRFCRDARVAAGLGYSLCRREENLAPARHWFRQAVESGMKTPEVLNNLAFCEFRSGHVAEAVQLLQESIARNPRSVVALYNLAAAEFKLAASTQNDRDNGRRRFHAAIEHIHTAIALAEESGDQLPQHYLLAATIHAVASRSAPPQEEPLHFESAIENAQRAVELGLHPAQLGILPQACERMSDDDRFRRLQKASIPQVAPPEIPHLENPLARLRPPYRLDCDSGRTPEKS